MKLIIDIDEKWESKCSWFSDRDIMDYLYGIVRNGTPIPDNATNGEVLMMMFPPSEYMNDDWWNAPYQKGGKDE